MSLAHRDPEAMARVLVSYIDDDARVAREIRSTFETSMSSHAVREIRKAKARSDSHTKRGRVAKGSMAKGWDWNGKQLRADMEIASRVFVKAIENARQSA